MGSGSQTPAPTQSTTYQLSPEQRQLMQLGMPGIRDFAATTPTRYPGPTTAGFDPAQTQAQNMMLSAASGGQSSLAQSGTDAANFWLQPDVWSPAVNTMAQRSIDAAVRPIYQGLTETALPAIRNEAVGSSNLGSSRQGIAEGRAIEGAETAAGDTAAKITSDLYGANVKAQLAALGLLPQTQGAELAPGLTTSAVGDVRQAMSQRQLDEMVGSFNFDQYAPFLQSKEILALLQGLPGGTTMSTGSVPPPAAPWAQALGGAATGASLGSMFGPIGTGVGAAGGAVLPFIFA